MLYQSSTICNSCHFYTIQYSKVTKKRQEYLNSDSVSISDIVAIEVIADIATIVTSDATVAIVKVKPHGNLETTHKTKPNPKYY